LTELELLPPADVLGRSRSEIEALWRRVFPETTDERFGEILPRHSGRRGLRFLTARADDGALVGFAYGYEGEPGQWWHDQVSAVLTEQQREDWLPPGHFEFVELMVDPDREGKGIGGRLHDELLAPLRAPTAVLSTQRSNRRALGFYARRGWEVVLSEIDFGEGYPPFAVLGKRLD
jgi:ribosomal protein S18 acetylase RimI-like enzyme